jgi:SNF2 family DNA or RNA helicase
MIPLNALPVPKYRFKDGATLRDYQERAIRAIVEGTPLRDEQGNYRPDWPVRDGTAIHVDVGLGKTIIGLSAIAELFASGTITKRVLVVAPIKVCETVWRQEAREWSHTAHLTFSLLRGDAKQRAFALYRSAHICLINPEGLKWLHEFLRGNWAFFDMLMIDESSMFKDSRSQRFKKLSDYGTRQHLKGLDGKVLRNKLGSMVKIPPHRFKRSVVMTGTPSPSGLLNVWAPLYLIDHGNRLHRDHDTFLGHYFHKTQQVATQVFKYDLNAEEAEARPLWQARDMAPERIHEKMADVVIELNAGDYGVLPKVMGDASKGDVPPSHLHRIELPPSVRAQYDMLEKEALMELQKDIIMAQNGGAKSMMCWQIANGAMYKTDDFGQKEWHELHTEKLDKLVELIDTLNANVIIPYYFKHDFARIVARLNKEGMAFASFNGKNAEKIVDQWNGGYTPILLIHPQSAAHGLNLQFGGHHMVWFTMLWSLERYIQTLGRIARSGQYNIVGNHHIVASRTTDELMLKSLQGHGSNQDRFRTALRQYQEIRGLGIFDGVGI